MSTIFCMNCGAELEDGARFCVECGSPTLLGAGLVEAEGKAQVACPSCGTLNDSDDRRCSKCGARLFRASRPSQASYPDVHARYAGTAEEERSIRARTLLIGGIVTAAVAGVILGGLLASGILGKRGQSLTGTEQTGSPGLITTDALTSGDGGEAVGSAGTQVRAMLPDYSWEELSIIAKEMTRQGSRDAAMALAREYHLVDEAGHMTSATKTIETEGMGTIAVRLVDVYHDNLANGEGKAGLTFMVEGVPFTHRMNAADDITGGWEGSELRSWLNTTVVNSFGEDLKTSIVAVDKLSDNEGHSTSVTCVTSTIDTLWLPSMVEIIGPIDWVWPSDPDNSGGYNAITNAEGGQYALFSDMGVVALESNAGLVQQGSGGVCAWWERSCSQSGVSKFRGVSEAGDPTEIYDASSELGVRFGFCL